MRKVQEKKQDKLTQHRHKKRRKALNKGAIESKSIRCDVCGTAAQEIHCRLVCPQCGNSRDCSDP